MLPVYMDHNSTTPTDPRVVDAMLPYLLEHWGNTGSRHRWGQAARDGLERARAQVAALIGAHADEIVFTSGGTESNNMVIHGSAAARPDRSHYVTTAVEHGAVRGPLEVLVARGATLDVLAVDGEGRAMLPDEVPAGTNLVSMMLANNEVGTVQPVRAMAALARDAGAWMHTDAAQAVGKIPVDVRELDVDLMSIAGHKLYAPKGVGALYIRRGIELSPWAYGAGQERGLRPGTIDVASAVALGAAAELARDGVVAEAARLQALKDRLWAGLAAAIPGAHRHGEERGLPNTLNVGFPGVTGAAVLDHARRTAASTGSACHDGETATPSTVLTAMGVPRDQALGAVRLSMGHGTSEADVDVVIDDLALAWRAAVTG